MFRLANEEFIILFLALPLLLVVYWLMRRNRKRKLAEFGINDHTRFLLNNVSEKKPALKFLLRILAVSCMITAIIRPQIGSGQEEVKRTGIDVMIALDVSNSMNARDILPSRLERSKQAVYRLIDKLQGDRIGIVVFAGQSFVQLPITTDYGAAKLFLSNISTGMVPVQGTAIGGAIEKCVSSIGDSSGRSSAIILITDGENHEDDAVEAAKAASEKGIVVHAIGMGSPDGSPVPGTNGSFIQDQQGNTVISKLDDSLLQQLADAGKGKFIRASNSDDGLSIIMKELDNLEKKEFSSRLYTIYDEQFGYFIAFALVLLVIESLISDRKSKLFDHFDLFGEKRKELRHD